MSALSNVPAMKNEAWRNRLAAEIEKSGRSKRDLSLAAGANAGYVHGILSEGKQPTVDKLISLCDALGVSPAYIIHGVEVSPDEIELIAHMRRDPEAVESILRLLSRRT